MTPVLALALDTLIFIAVVTPSFGIIVQMGKSRRIRLIERVARDGKLHSLIAGTCTLLLIQHPLSAGVLYYMFVPGFTVSILH